MPQQQTISFRIDTLIFHLSDYDADQVIKTVTQFNTKRTISGLDDDLNTEIVAPSKVLAFMDYIRENPSKFPELVGKTVYVHTQELWLSESIAISSTDIRRGFDLDIEYPDDDLLMPVIRLQYEAAPLLERSEKAERFFADFNAAIQPLEESLKTVEQNSAAHSRLLSDLSLFKYKRFSAARTSFLNRKLLLELQPDNATYKAEYEKAELCLRNNFAPPRHGMN